MTRKASSRIRASGAIAFLTALVFGPAVALLFLYFGGEPLEAALTDASAVVMAWFPVMAWIAVFAGHFRIWHAAIPVGVAAGIEASAALTPLDPLTLLGHAAGPLASKVDPNVLGKTLLAVSGFFAAGAACFWRMTLYRLIVACSSGAQIATLVLFHLVAVTWPFAGMVEAETALFRAAVLRDGGLGALCDLNGRICFSGTPEATAVWASGVLPDPSTVLRTLEDTRQVGPMLFTWIERPKPPELGRIGLVTLLKHAPGETTLMIETAGASMVYRQLRLGLGVLLAAFSQAWTIITLLVLARHGDYAFDLQARRWRRL